MSDEVTANTAQDNYWNSAAGRKWAQFQDEMDTSFGPMLAQLLARADVSPDARVLDIGCGTGASVLGISSQLSGSGRVEGVDISVPLLEMARARATAQGLMNASFTLADAQHHKFEANSVDHIISRLGVMFFGDPVVAFNNLSSALRPSGRLNFVCWRGLEENPWFKIPRDAAAARVGFGKPGDPDAPGPMAFRDCDRVVALLEDTGFREISAEIVTVPLTPKGTPKDVASLVLEFGPAIRLLKEMNGTKDDSAAVAEAIESEIAKFETPEGVRVPAMMNYVSATAP